MVENIKKLGEVIDALAELMPKIGNLFKLSTNMALKAGTLIAVFKLIIDSIIR